MPLYSALPRVGQRQIVSQEHATVFSGNPFRKVFFRLLGGDEGAATEAPGVSRMEVYLSVEKPILAMGDGVEVVLTVADPANIDAVSDTALAPKITQIEGVLVLHEVDDEGRARPQPLREDAIHYRGPALDRLRVDLTPIGAAGHYQLSFRGAVTPADCDPAETSNRPVVFALAEV